MLLVGAFLCRFGNWEAMRKDPKPGLEGKFFLEEAKKGRMHHQSQFRTPSISSDESTSCLAFYGSTTRSISPTRIT